MIGLQEIRTVQSVVNNMVLYAACIAGLRRRPWPQLGGAPCKTRALMHNISLYICLLLFGSSWWLLSFLLTPWCRVLLQKLTGLQLVKKFPAFHGNRMFITAFTSVRHLSLSWASPIQSIYPHPTSWRSILILSTHLRLGLPSTARSWR